MATSDEAKTNYPALLIVNGYVLAANDEAKEYEDILGDIVEEHSYGGFPMEKFGEWLAENRHGAKLSSAADSEGALHVIVTFE
jgi:hypothetical protein